MEQENTPVSRHFIQNEIDRDLKEGNYDRVQTRFPPEPNGLLHIGHAKSILLNSGIAREYGGTFYLRFDDTNPVKEKEEFMNAIIRDVEWLTGGLETPVQYASDHFDAMYETAVRLIKRGKAYISTLSADELRETRGTLTSPGVNDPDRDRPVEESLRLFEEMKSGSVPDGAMTLRAKNRHGVPEHEHARSGSLPRRPHHPPAHGGQVVHLSDVRFRPSAGGRLRRHHAFAVHHGI